MSLILRLRALCLTAVVASGLLLPFADGLAFHSGTGERHGRLSLQSPDTPARHGQVCALGVEAPKALGAAPPELPAELAFEPTSTSRYPVTTALPADPLQRGAPPRAPPDALTA